MAKRRGKRRGKTLLSAATGLGLLRRGLTGGARWRVGLGLGIVGLSLARRAIRKEERVVFSTELAPGAAIEIRHRERPSR